MNRDLRYDEEDDDLNLEVPAYNQTLSRNCLSFLKGYVCKNFKATMLISLLLLVLIVQWSTNISLNQELQTHKRFLNDCHKRREELLRATELLKQNFSDEIEVCKLKEGKISKELTKVKHEFSEALRKNMIYQNQLDLIKICEEQIENMRTCFMTLDRYLKLKGKVEHYLSEYESEEKTRLAEHLPNCIMELSGDSFLELKDLFQKHFNSNCKFKQALEYSVTTGNFEKMKAEQEHANNTITVSKTCSFMCNLMSPHPKSKFEIMLDTITHYFNLLYAYLF